MDNVDQTWICFQQYLKLNLFQKLINKLAYDIFIDLYQWHPESCQGNLNLEKFNKKLIQEPLNPRFKDYENYTDYEFYHSEPSFDFTIYIFLDLMKKHFESSERIDSKASKTLFQSIDKIKRIRNTLAHKYLWEEEEYEKFKNDLSMHVSELCNSAHVICTSLNQERINYVSENKNISEKIEQVWQSKLQAKRSQITLQEVLDSPEGSTFKEFVLKCCKELHEVYGSLNACPSFSLTDSKFSFPVEEVFVPVTLKVKEKKVKYQELLSLKGRKQKTAPPFVIISGNAGHGKTTICKKLTKEWCNSYDKPNGGDSIHISEYDLVLLIEVKRAKEKRLYQYLKETLLKDSLRKSEEFQIMSFLKFLKVLIIVDAYDEKSDQAENLISNMIEELPDKKYLITTRPYYKTEIFTLLKKHHRYIDAELESFGNEEEKKFIDKVFGILKEKVPCLKSGDNRKYYNYLQKLPADFQHAVKIPLMNLLLINIWINRRENSKPLPTVTYTTLYTEFFELQKYTVVEMIALQHTEILKNEDLSKIIDQMITLLAEHAYETEVKKNSKNYIDGSIILEKLKQVGTEIEEKQCKNFLSTLFLHIPDVRNCNQFEYLHNTQREYLIALHATSLLTKTDSVQSLEHLLLFKSISNECSKTFAFTLSLLNGKDKLKLYIDKINMILREHFENYDLLWDVLYETMTMTETSNDLQANSCLCKELCKLLSRSRDWKLHDDNVVNALSLLYYIDFQPTTCELHIRNHNPQDIPMFLFNLNRLGFSKKAKHNDFITELDLLFDEHLLPKRESFSDEFFNNLNFWAKLIKFHGSLSEETIHIIGTFPHLKEIKLRVTSEKILNKLSEISSMKEKFKKLKKITLVFDKPFINMKEMAKPLTFDRGTNISIEIHSVSNNKDHLQMLKNLKPLNSFSSVYLNFNENISAKKVEQLCKKLENEHLIYEKLLIRSPNSVDEGTFLYLNQNISFVLKWNEHGN